MQIQQVYVASYVAIRLEMITDTQLTLLTTEVDAPDFINISAISL